MNKKDGSVQTVTSIFCNQLEYTQSKEATKWISELLDITIECWCLWNTYTHPVLYFEGIDIIQNSYWTVSAWLNWADEYINSHIFTISTITSMMDYLAQYFYIDTSDTLAYLHSLCLLRLSHLLVYIVHCLQLYLMSPSKSAVQRILLIHKHSGWKWGFP